MRRLELDFISRPPIGNAAGIAIFAAGAAMLAATAFDATDRAEQRRALEQQRASAYSRVHAREPRPQSAAQMRPEDLRTVREAAAVAARLTLPWQRLFDETAEAAGEGVALTGLQPDAPSRTARITGLARDLAAANAFVARLQTKPGFAQAYLAQHDTQRKDPEAGLGFVVLAVWREELK